MAQNSLHTLAYPYDKYNSKNYLQREHFVMFPRHQIVDLYFLLDVGLSG